MARPKHNTSHHTSSSMSKSNSTSLTSVLARLSVTDYTTMSYLRGDPETLDAFRKLQEQHHIVLFTPAVPTLEDAPPDQDPFEPFGRALYEQHGAQVKHVPYVPSKGMTQYHEAMLSYASAVVVVIAEPAGESLSTKSKAESFQVQAQHLSKFSKKIKVPAILIVISQTILKEKIKGASFGVILHAQSYDQVVLGQLAAATAVKQEVAEEQE